MADSHYLDDADGPRPPEDDARDQKISAAIAELAELERHGWQRVGGSGTELCDPHDPEATVWLNPYTGDVLLSPRYIERIKALLPPRTGEGRHEV